MWYKLRFAVCRKRDCKDDVTVKMMLHETIHNDDF